MVTVPVALASSNVTVHLSTVPCSEKVSPDYGRRLVLLDEIYWDGAVRLASVCRQVPSAEYCKGIEDLSFQTIINHAKAEGEVLRL